MNPSSEVTRIWSLVGAVALGAMSVWFFAPRAKDEPPQAPLISLEKMGHLVAVKMNYSDVIEFTEKRTQDIPWTQWELRLGGTKVLLVAKGDCTVGTDLRLAKYTEINREAHTLTLVMQAPQPIVARVNHAPRERGGSYFYAITSEGLEPLIPDSSNRTRAVDNALARAQQEIEKACREPGVLATARTNTEALLAPTFQALGWTPTFTWAP